jgi:hypothetical protein
MPPRPSATERRFVLTIGGVVCGFVTSAEGGDISAPVIREPGGAFVRKRLGPPAPTPIDLSFDLSLDKAVYEWIARAWAGDATPRSGSLIELDPNNQARVELTFENAVIAATTVPAMDAASKTPCVLSVRLVAALTSRLARSGPVAGMTAKPKKAWLPSNFRLELGDVDTKRVSRVDAFTVPTGEKVGVDFPDLRVQLAETSSEQWTSWHDEFVVQGKNDDQGEKVGALVFLAPDQKAELGRVKLAGVGIYRLAPRPAPEGPEQVGRMQASLYCEQMELAI